MRIRTVLLLALSLLGSAAAGDPADPLRELETRVQEADARHAGEPHVETATLLVELAKARYDSGDAVRAGPTYAKALAMLDRLADSDPVTKAVVLDGLGACLNQLNRPAEAVPHLRRSVATFRKAIEGDDERFALTLFHLANAEQRGGRPDLAVAPAREAAEMLKRLPSPDARLSCCSIHVLGECLLYSGDIEAAIPVLEEAVSAFRRHGDRYAGDLSWALTTLATALEEVGRAQEALPHHRAALEARSKALGPDHFWVARAHVRLAGCLGATGRPEEALRSCETAMTLYRRMFPGDSPHIAIVLNLRGGALLSLGRPADALPALEEAVAVLVRVGVEDPQLLGGAVGNLGGCLFELGRYDEALLRFREADRIFVRQYGEDHPARTVEAMNIAACLSRLGRLDEAIAMNREFAMRERRLAKGGSLRLAGVLANLSRDLHELGRNKEALALALEALALGKELGETRSSLAGNHGCVALSLAGLGRPEEALPHLERGLEIARADDEPGIRQFLAEVLGRLLAEDLARPRDAIPVLAESIEILESMRRRASSLPERERALHLGAARRLEVFDVMARAQLAVGRADEALRALEQGRARGLLDLLDRSRFDVLAAARASSTPDERSRLDRVETRVRDADARVGRLAHALAAGAVRPGEIREELLAARRVRQDAVRERARLVRDRVPGAIPAGPDEVRALLGAEDRLLVYSFTGRDGLLLVVPPGKGKVRGYPLTWPDGSPASEDTVAARVDAYLEGLSVRGDSADGMSLGEPAPDLPAIGEALMSALIPEEVWKEIRGLDRVHVVPQGPLHRLPFETLIVKPGPDARRRVYWIDEGPSVAYGPSASVLLRARRIAEDGLQRTAELAAVALGDPVFSHKGPRGVTRAGRARPRALVPLPGTRREVLAVRDALAGDKPERVTVLLGKDASAPKLLAAAPRARYLHLATHHVVDDLDGASYSRLALTQPQSPSAEDDGFLMLGDLLERWRGILRSCELAVLSGCETNRGPLQRDEGVYAMPIGFLVAGCPSVIASLWRVDDESTATLMAGFYRGLGGDASAGKLRAFTAARRELRKTRPDPYFWAPFVFLGDPR